ncbi:NAD+ synthase [Chromobacterium sphagni]|uniref:Glutamine-dependent NAD(+) synthetase n=1 Tax=Chromobacterium sphagni TaxID=1903179 RepID=A0A1S1X4S1_9NEIS|nr:NAD+ synthase [Chromobacterium sphagni]OHX14430.1 NAD+ synthase [Chromobacterium sphagni]OHX19810.1 NAD+ synthase [Chromobacterium sphagni]
MRIALAQFNPIVGDIAGNAEKILSLAHAAIVQGADVLVTPELALTGYSPEDLLLRDSFYREVAKGLDTLEQLDGITLVIGHPVKLGNERFNAATVLRDGHRLGQYHKMLLPNNEVFDECRYFTPGAAPLVFEQNGVKVGVLICEDVWSLEPAAETADAGAEVVLALNASPFHRNKIEARHEALRYRVEETGLPFAYVNLAGGQDELVFDGASFAVDKSGRVVAQAAAYDDELLLVDFADGDLQQGKQTALPGPLESVYRTLVVGVRDYIGKNGFPGTLLGLSGGIDSALTLAVAVDALGADKVHAVMMPSRYTADISVTDSRDMIARLGVKYDEIEIWPMYESFMAGLAPSFAGLEMDTTEENLQARIRGTLLMALSNKSGKLVLTTGNKSEMTTGYCTLYGDMAGGFAVLKDVAKTLVFELCRWRNTVSDVIPERIITRPPSAELRPDQKDQDSLPPYEVLDAIMARYVEGNQSAADIIAAGFAKADVDRVVRLLKINEYKRRQAPVGPRVTQRGFGKDWRYPITNRFS